MGWKDWSYALKTAIIYSIIYIIIITSFLTYINLTCSGERCLIFIFLPIIIGYIIIIWIMGLIVGKIIEKISGKKLSDAKKGFLVGLIIGLSIFLLWVTPLFLIGADEMPYLYLTGITLLVIIIGWIIGKIRKKNK